jgi:hypothetical protein
MKIFGFKAEYVAGFLILAYFMGWLAFAGLRPAAISGQAADTKLDGGAMCTGGSTPSFDVLTSNLAVPGTAIATPAYTFYYQDQKPTAIGSTPVTTYGPGDPYTLLVSSGTGYYNTSVNGVFDSCKKNVQVKLAPRTTITRYSLYNPGTATNNSNGTAASPNSLAIGSGEVVTLDYVLKCNAADTFCVDPNGGFFVLSFDVNTTEFDTSVGKTELISTSDTNVERISVPIVESGTAEVSFKVTPTKQFKNYDTLQLRIKLAAKASFNPTGVATTSCNTGVNGATVVGLRLRESDWTKNSITGQPMYGVENDAGTAVLPLQTDAICYT